jgi:hypothetical protein
VAAFVNFYITNVAEQLGTAADQIGYIPVPVLRQNIDRAMWLQAMGMEDMIPAALLEMMAEMAAEAEASS